jgi:hypothetical protein
MWEYRLVWPRSKPAGWDATWQRGLDILSIESRAVEERPDTYLVLLDRADAGLKLRGGQEEDFDLKVLHRRSGRWELWEKCAFFEWNSLEVARVSAMLRMSATGTGHLGENSPGKGVEAFLASAGVRRTQISIGKKRLQAAAGDLLATWPASCVDPRWLVELVEITLPDRTAPVFSLCLESVEPQTGGNEPVPAAGGLCCGYPELLIRHLKGSI